MCAGVGVWVLLKSPLKSLFCVKHPIFINISWDFDELSTKTQHAPYNVWSSKHPPAGCTLDGNVIVRSKRYPPFESGLPPPLGITEVPGVYFFPFYVWISFFFHRAGQAFFFFPCGSSVFFLLRVGQVFYFLLLSGSSFFFFFTKTSCSPPWSLMVHPLVL